MTKKITKPVCSAPARNPKRKASPSTSRVGPDPKVPKRNDPEDDAPRPVPNDVRIIESHNPVKSQNDPNEYKIIKLSNGLRTLLISRKAPNKGTRLTKVTSVALAVNIGGLQDPETALGLAHFTEHVVHFGSKKFPREEELFEWVLSLGFLNAETCRFITQYCNQVSDMILDKNLELFSEMLTNPLMKVEFLNREANAVDDEFYLNQPIFRTLLIQTHIGYPDGPKHPLGRFTVGSLDTLGGNRTNTVHEEMVKTFKNNYVASAMTLVINSTKSMEEMEMLTIKHFSKLNHGVRKVRFETEQKDAKEDRLRLHLMGRYIFLQGISNRSELALIWHLPAKVWMKDKHDKTMDVIIFLLNNSSEKGLIAYLKAEGLIWAAGAGHNNTPYAIILMMFYDLTDKGRIPENTVRIQEATFQYTKHLQQMSELELRDCFDQIRVEKLRNFNFGSHRYNIQTTIDCALRMQSVERPQEVVNFDSWEKASFNFARIRGALKRLNPTPSEDDKIPGVTVIETLPKHASLEVKTTALQEKVKDLKIEEEPYTKAKYLNLPRRAIINDDNFRSSYAGVFGSPKISPYLELEVAHFRKEIQKRGGGGDEATPPLRFLIAPVNHGNIVPRTRLNFKSRVDPPGSTSTPKIAGVHLGHSEFGLDPYRCIVFITFYTSKQRARTSRGFALNWLWTLYIKESLEKYRTEFLLAGYDFSISDDDGVFSVYIKGFPTHLQDISVRIVRKVFGDPITENIFNLAKENLIRTTEIGLGKPGCLSEYINNILFYDEDFKMDCLWIVKELSFADLQSIVNAHRRSTYVKVILKGNVPVTYFRNLAVTLDEMEFGPYKDQVPRPLNYAIPRPDFHYPGETCLRVRNFANCTYNNTVTNLYILGNSHDSSDHQARCFLAASNFLSQKAFQHLRTKEQLGYVIKAGPREFDEMRFPVSAIYVTIVATVGKHTPCELDQKIDQFLAKYGEYLKALPDPVYDSVFKMGYTGVGKDEVAKYINAKFGEGFGVPERKWKCRKRGIRKLSIQELAAGNPTIKQKPCNCDICAGISEWKKGQTLYESSLEFAIGNKENKDYFISLPKD